MRSAWNVPLDILTRQAFNAHMPVIVLNDPTTYPMIKATYDMLTALQEEFRIRRSDREQDMKRWGLMAESVAELATQVAAYQREAQTDTAFYEDMIARMNKAAAALEQGEH